MLPGHLILRRPLRRTNLNALDPPESFFLIACPGVPGRGLKRSYISDKVSVNKVLGPKTVSSFSDSKRNLFLSTQKNKTKG